MTKIKNFFGAYDTEITMLLVAYVVFDIIF